MSPQHSPEQAASLPLTWSTWPHSLSPLALRSLILLLSSTEPPLVLPQLLLPLKHRLLPTLANLLRKRRVQVQVQVQVLELELEQELEKVAKPSQRPPPARRP
jgi:hypothetical protein